ncbi:MAG: aquaporin family protein [Candidatus Omnitrophota bacterium]|nr:MAG: aquaporin family protein [Candidatus Omnitrophota bacterium]
MLKKWHDLAGELLGTFILVFFGCGSVAVTILFSSLMGLFQVAIVWGVGVTLAIYATRHLSCAHINPAVSLAMVIAGRMPLKKLGTYWAGQFLGAFLAAAALYAVFSSSIVQYETLNGIVRGSPESVRTARMFGEFYLNSQSGDSISITAFGAFLAEAIGTFLLVFLIFSLTEGCNVGRPDRSLAPLFIGLTVTAIICIIAPLTQAGINPARDLSARMFAYLAGWRNAAFPDKQFGFLTVYVLGPFVGGSVAALLFTKIIQPLMLHKQTLSPADKCD